MKKYSSPFDPEFLRKFAELASALDSLNLTAEYPLEVNKRNSGQSIRLVPLEMWGKIIGQDAEGSSESVSDDDDSGGITDWLVKEIFPIRGGKWIESPNPRIVTAYEVMGRDLNPGDIVECKYTSAGDWRIINCCGQSPGSMPSSEEGSFPEGSLPEGSSPSGCTSSDVLKLCYETCDANGKPVIKCVDVTASVGGMPVIFTQCDDHSGGGSDGGGGGEVPPGPSGSMSGGMGFSGESDVVVGYNGDTGSNNQFLALFGGVADFSTGDTFVVGGQSSLNGLADISVSGNVNTGGQGSLSGSANVAGSINIDTSGQGSLSGSATASVSSSFSPSGKSAMTGVASVSWSTSYLPSGHIIFTGFASAVEQDGGS